MTITLPITTPLIRPITDVIDRAFPGGASMDTSWVVVGATIDIDLVNRRYYWGNALRTEAEFTTFALDTATFGPLGLTPSNLTNITLALAGILTPSAGGAVAVAYAHASVPAAAKLIWQIDDGTTNNMVRNAQTTVANIQLAVTDTAVSQCSVISGNQTALGVRHGAAVSWSANNFLQASNGAAATGDTLGTVPAGMATLRVARSTSTSTQIAGSVARLVLFNAPKTQTELNALSTQMQTG